MLSVQSWFLGVMVWTVMSEGTTAGTTTDVVS